MMTPSFHFSTTRPTLPPYRSYESVDGVAVADRPEHALAAGFWRCVEIIGGVGIGLALTAIPFPGE